MIFPHQSKSKKKKKRNFVIFFQLPYLLLPIFILIRSDLNFNLFFNTSFGSTSPSFKFSNNFNDT